MEDFKPVDAEKVELKRRNTSKRKVIEPVVTEKRELENSEKSTLVDLEDFSGSQNFNEGI